MVSASALDQPFEVANSAAPEISHDSMLVALWLHGRGPHTMRAYRFEVERFQKFISPFSFCDLRLKNVQDYFDYLSALALKTPSAGRPAPNTLRRAQSALKSLFSFGVGVRYLPVNLGLFLRAIPAKDSLSERILDEPSVHRLIACVPNGASATRNRAMLTLLYAAGLRVSELCSLKWRDVMPRSDAGQITVFGKGGKTRVVLLSLSTWRVLVAIRPEAASPDAPVFASQKGGTSLDVSQVLRIVKRAARAAGIEAHVSPHWFRHAHASHALERGCPISLVQATLGHAQVSTTGRYLHARPGDSSARYLGV